MHKSVGRKNFLFNHVCVCLCIQNSRVVGQNIFPECFLSSALKKILTRKMRSSMGKYYTGNLWAVQNHNVGSLVQRLRITRHQQNNINLGFSCKNRFNALNLALTGLRNSRQKKKQIHISTEEACGGLTFLESCQIMVCANRQVIRSYSGDGQCNRRDGMVGLYYVIQLN